MLEHPNKTRAFVKGEIHDARPNQKGFRHEADEETISLAKEMKKLIEYFGLSEVDVYNIIKNHFGEGTGFQTTRMFMNKIYGPAFRPRYATICKYRYLVSYLKNRKKQFAKPGKSLRLSKSKEDATTKQNIPDEH